MNRLSKIVEFSVIAYLLCCFPIKAQQEWAPVGAIWHYQFSSENCGLPINITEYITYESVKDTLINSQTCRIIESKFYQYNGDTSNLGREIMYGDSVNVYVYRNNKFYRIFDFSAQSGDTITAIDTVFEGFFHLSFDTSDLFEYVIDSISTYVINGDSLKQYYTSPTDSSDWTLGYPLGILLENIGIKGPALVACFIGEARYYGTWNTFGSIRCYQDPDVSYNFMGIKCDTLCIDPNGISVNARKDNFLKVYPNPFNDRIIVESPPQKESCIIQIYNTLGQIVYNLNVNNLMFKYPIDLSFLPGGLYNLNIIQENNVYYNSRIIKY